MIGIATKMRQAVESRSSGRSGYSTDRFTGYAGGGGGGIAIVLLPSRLIHAIPRLRVVFRKRSCDDFWVRRSSLLAELTPLKQGAPFEPFARRGRDARGDRVLHPEGHR